MRVVHVHRSEKVVVVGHGGDGVCARIGNILTIRYLGAVGVGNWMFFDQVSVSCWFVLGCECEYPFKAEGIYLSSSRFKAEAKPTPGHVPTAKTRETDHIHSNFVFVGLLPIMGMGLSGPTGPIPAGVMRERDECCSCTALWQSGAQAAAAGG